jgi:flagellin
LGAAQGTETAATYGLAASNAITTANTNTSTSSTVDTADVKTVDDSNKVLIQIDAALQQLATTGAQLGAYQNRFQAAVTGLNTNATNLTSARSQIQDTDYAAATSALSKAQILQQASTAMVSQANTIPQNILTLLQKLP